VLDPHHCFPARRQRSCATGGVSLAVHVSAGTKAWRGRHCRCWRSKTHAVDVALVHMRIYASVGLLASKHVSMLMHLRQEHRWGKVAC